MAEEKKQKRPTKPDRLKPLSLHPLTPEKALQAFMRVKRKKVTKAMIRKVQEKKDGPPLV